MEISLPTPQGPCAAIEINALELATRERGVVCVAVRKKEAACLLLHRVD